jgi:osmotically-inducible protein OsmY
MSKSKEALMSASFRLPLAASLFLMGAWFVPQAVSAEPLSDATLTFQARRALANDDRLSAFNIGVRVRDGGATLVGRVPTAELVGSAEECLRKVHGLRGVRSELLVGTVTESPPLRMPVESAPAAPDPEPVALLAPVLNSPADDRPAVTLSGRTQEPAADADRALQEAVERLRWADPRFLRVKVEVRDGVVRLSGQVVRGQDGMDLARLASRLRGVKDVLLETREAPVFPGRTP